MSKSNRELRAERAAAALRAQQAKERRRNLLVVLGVVALVVVIIGGGFLINSIRGNNDGVKADPVATSSSPGSSSGGATTSDNPYGVSVGDKSAPHTVIVYEDFLCPFCGMFEAASHEGLAAAAAAGTVYLEYRPFDLLGTSDSSYSVASDSAFKVVLDAAGPVVAKKFHDELYADQPSEEGPFPGASFFLAKAVAAGANEADVKDGIDNQTQTAWVKAATKAAIAANVQSTPTILLDGKEFTDGATSADIAANLVKAVS